MPSVPVTALAASEPYWPTRRPCFRITVTRARIAPFWASAWRKNTGA